VRPKRLSPRQQAKRNQAVIALATVCYSWAKAREEGAGAEWLDEVLYRVHYEVETCRRLGLSEETIQETEHFVLDILPGLPAELRDLAIAAKRWSPWPVSEEGTCP